jgi:hypothetical protein
VNSSFPTVEIKINTKTSLKEAISQRQPPFNNPTEFLTFSFRSGEPVKVKEKNLPFFKFGKELKERLDKKEF